MDDFIKLIKETFVTNEIGVQIATETQTEVLAHIQTASRSEWAAAGQNGLQPSFVAVTNRVNYDGEKIAILNGQRYSIYRVYLPNNSDMIELYCEQRAGS